MPYLIDRMSLYPSTATPCSSMCRTNYTRHIFPPFNQTACAAISIHAVCCTEPSLTYILAIMQPPSQAVLQALSAHGMCTAHWLTELMLCTCRARFLQTELLQCMHIVATQQQPPKLLSPRCFHSFQWRPSPPPRLPRPQLGFLIMALS